MQLPKSQSLKHTNGPPAFIVWLSYQRRSEVLAPLLGVNSPLYLPHYFSSSWLRPLDYLVKLFKTAQYLRRSRSSYAVLQAPPIFAAFAALATGTPYVVDIHNGLVQSFWAKLPFTHFLLKRANALIAHNSEIAAEVSLRVPGARVVVIQDPVERIDDKGQVRARGNVLFICSFDRDEPVALILEVIRALPEYTFTITANPRRLAPELEAAYRDCPNLVLSGFLATAEYHALLTSSQVAVVLSTFLSVQPSGAVEALSSNTPLVVSRTTLTKVLFGEWAILCENTLSSVVNGIREAGTEPKSLEAYRSAWNDGVAKGITQLEQIVDVSAAQSRLD